MMELKSLTSYCSACTKQQHGHVLLFPFHFIVPRDVLDIQEPEKYEFYSCVYFWYHICVGFD